jgi:hypothetical protein
MKERIRYEGEFEKQLKEKADQYKMYPSDKVWNEVYSSLHTRRRRFVAGMSLLIGGILILAGSQLISPATHVSAKPTIQKANSTTKPSIATTLPSFAEGDLVSAASASTDYTKLPAENRTVNTPYIISSGPVQSSVTAVPFSENLQEKNVNSAHVRSNQSENLNAQDRQEISPSAAPELHESLTLLPNIAETNSVSSELSPENSATQLTHLRNDRYSWQIYFTPTLNTRYLTGMNYQSLARSIQSAPIMLVNISNVNGFVDNTPVLGYTLGGNILYHLSKNISLKAGLEFSFSRYYIRTYNSGSSQTSAALNTYFGYVADSLNSVPGSGTDKNPQHYQNKYYVISVPVGVEMKVAGSGRVQLHVGATLQPSYLLNTDAYVLTNDYKGYSKDAQAYRRWNVNAGAEAYISYGVGNVRWELGPQVRYQIFSTYKDSYPLKENMLNYGIRIGISKTIR